MPLYRSMDPGELNNNLNEIISDDEIVLHENFLSKQDALPSDDSEDYDKKQLNIQIEKFSTARRFLLVFTIYSALFFRIGWFITPVYFVCWILSKRRRGFVLVAIILLSVDMFMVLILRGVNSGTLFDIAVFSLTLIFLIVRVIAWKKIK